MRRTRRVPCLPQVEMIKAVELLDDIYRSEGAGCCMHIVTDDLNLKDSDIQFCLEQAVPDGCEKCERLARWMLRMSATQRHKLCTGGYARMMEVVQAERKRRICKGLGVKLDPYGFPVNPLLPQDRSIVNKHPEGFLGRRTDGKSGRALQDELVKYSRFQALVLRGKPKAEAYAEVYGEVLFDATTEEPSS